MTSRARNDRIRAVVIDDSPSARELLVAILQEAGDITVVGTGANGEDAIRLTEQMRPDVVTMDVRMPKMDGLEATRRIMRHVPTPIVIVTADLMPSGMNLTFEALRAGALTVVGKPGLADEETCRQVVQMVRLMAKVPVVHHWGYNEPRAPGEQARPAVPAPAIKAETRQRLQMIGIASSTGGPATLAKILGPLPADFPIPILVVQHVTQGFVAGLAEWLNSVTSLQVGLASHGGSPRPGSVLLAPDDYHMQVNDRGIVELYKGPPYKGLRPSANHLFRSLAHVYGPRAMGIVLTGMGDDGAQGLEELHRAGGLTLAQDEQSCVVYGMPREAIARNAIDHILTLEQITSTLEHLASTRRRGEKRVV